MDKLPTFVPLCHLRPRKPLVVRGRPGQEAGWLHARDSGRIWFPTADAGLLEGGGALLAPTAMVQWRNSARSAVRKFRVDLLASGTMCACL